MAKCVSNGRFFWIFFWNFVFFFSCFCRSRKWWRRANTKSGKRSIISVLAWSVRTKKRCAPTAQLRPIRSKTVSPVRFVTFLLSEHWIENLLTVVGGRIASGRLRARLAGVGDVANKVGAPKVCSQSFCTLSSMALLLFRRFWMPQRRLVAS